MKDLIEAADALRREVHAIIGELKEKINDMDEKTQINTLRINELVSQLKAIEEMIKNNKSTMQTPFSSPTRPTAGGDDLPSCA